MTHQSSDHGPGHEPRGREAAELPRFHGPGDDAGVGAARRPRTARQRWTTVAVAAIVVALLLVMLVLHLTGAAGPGMHG
jgi:hypothetical protein